MTKKVSFFLFLVFGLLFISNSVLYAQGTETLLTGKTVDEQGKPVGFTTVVIKNQNTGFSTGITSAEDGTFSVRELPVGGPYTIEISFLGYQTQRYEGYILTQGSVISIGNIILKENIEGLDSVVVIAETTPFTSKVSVGRELSIGAKYLDQIPTLSRDFKDLANYSSQSSIPVNKERYGISIAGVKSTGIGYTIDGVNARRGVFGGTSTDAAFILSMEAVEEFKVETNNYTVLGPRNGGGAIKAITKKGSNNLKASTWGYYTGDALSQGRDFKGQNLNSSFTNWQGGFKVSGPIVKDKLTYFVLYDRYKKSAPTNSGLLNYDLFSAEEQQNIQQSEVERLLSLLKNNGVIENSGLRYQTGTFLKEDITQNFFLRLDWNISDIHKLTGRFSYLDYKGNYNPSAVYVNYMIKDRAFGWANRSFRGLLNLKSYFESGNLNDLKINYTTDNRFLTISGEKAFPSVSVKMGNSGVAFGTPWWGGEEIYSTQFQIVDDYSFRTNNGWDITIGTNNLMHYSREYYPHETGGVMSYASLDDLENNNVDSWERLLPTDGNPAKRYYQYPLIETSLYTQIDKLITDNIKLNAGLRWDAYFINKKSSKNKDLEAVGIKTSQGVSDWNNIQPRASINWDINGKGTDIINAGIGAFSSEWTTHAYTFSLRGNGVDYRKLHINRDSPKAVRDFVGGSWKLQRTDQPTAEQLKTVGADVTKEPTSIVTVDPNLKVPTTWKTNITYTHYLSDWFRIGVSGYYSKTYNQNYFRDINLKVKKDGSGQPILSADGRLQYDRKYAGFNEIVQYTNAEWASTYLAGTVEFGFFYKDGLLNLSYTLADVRGEAPYGAGSSWMQGQGIGYSYETYPSQVADWSSGYVINNKFVIMFSSPSYYGFTLSGSFTTGQYERFTIRTSQDFNGIGNEGGGDGRVQAGDLAYVYPTNYQNSTIASDMRTLLSNTSPEYKAALESSFGSFAAQNIGKQPWQYQTNLTLKKVFELKDVKMSFRIDAFNIVNLIDYASGYNYSITNLNLYGRDALGNIKINTEAGKKVPVFNPNQLGRIQLGFKIEM